MTFRRVLVAGAIAATFAILLVRGADHGDAPGVRINSRLDINDVYAFQAPGNAGHTVLIMTVSPLAGITGATTFHPQGKYEFKIDSNADAVEDITLRVTFSNPDDHGVQRVRLRSIPGRGRDDDDEDGDDRHGDDRRGDDVQAAGLTGQDIPVRGGGTLRAGLFDDPFFFDLLAFKNGLAFCPGGVGTNFFRGLNTLAIVLEVPSTHFGTSSIGVWGHTSQGGKTIDRMGRPAINTALIPKDLKDAFNDGKPVDDFKNFGQVVTNSLTSLGAANPSALAHFLLPDILTVDTSDAGGFPNGRRLQDDVIDIELALVTNNKVTTDCVANDSTFRTTFPYLGVPNP
jgi:uncharacterized protein DUF4331